MYDVKSSFKRFFGSNVKLIFVESIYDIKNGLCGMKRDVLLHLFRVIEKRSEMSYAMKDRSIRSIVGICEEHIKWITHPYFLEGRKRFMSIPVSFGINLEKVCSFTQTPAGKLYTFYDSDFWQSVFLDKSISDGVFCWTVRIKYSKGEKYSSLRIGALPTHILQRTLRSSSTPWKDSPWVDYNWTSKPFDNWSFSFFRKGYRNPTSGPEELVHVCNTDLVPDNAVVSLEADADTHTLSLFVDGIKNPLCYVDVNGPLNMGVSGLNGPSFLSVSFLRLPCATPSPVVCTLYKYDRDE